MRNINSSRGEEKESYLSIYFGNCFLIGLLVHLYSIPNIFFVYIDDMWRLVAILLWLSYFVAVAIGSFVDYRFPSHDRFGSYSFVFTLGLWSMMTTNLYGVQALVEQPLYQEVYINLLWIQLLLILLSWINLISVHVRKLLGRTVTIILGAFFVFHLLGVFASTKGMGIYVFLFGKDAAVSLIWPGIALFFSGLWTRVIMGVGVDLDITPEERAREVARVKEREEDKKRKISEEMLSNGRYLEYGELDYFVAEDISKYREKGTKTFEDVEFLYMEDGVRYFSRMDLSSPKEMVLYKENKQWYCRTEGQESELVFLADERLEEDCHEFEVDKHTYLERAINGSRLVPRFVELPSDIDESKVDRYG
ncbi:hypothetical protein NSQ26_13080 [Bacillus sp. FSL W7-1360]